MRVVPVAAGDELIAESSRGPARRAATAGDPEVDLTSEAPSRAADHSAVPPVTQGSAMLGHPTPKEGEALPLFKNSNEEPEYLQRKDACLEKQREFERLRTRVLGRALTSAVSCWLLSPSLQPQNGPLPSNCL